MCEISLDGITCRKWKQQPAWLRFTESGRWQIETTKNQGDCSESWRKELFASKEKGSGWELIGRQKLSSFKEGKSVVVRMEWHGKSTRAPFGQ